MEDYIAIIRVPFSVPAGERDKALRSLLAKVDDFEFTHSSSGKARPEIVEVERPEQWPDWE